MRRASEDRDDDLHQRAARPVLLLARPVLVATVTLVASACGPAGEEASPPPSALPSEATGHLESVVADLDAYWAEVIAEGYSTPTIVAFRRGEIPDTVCADGTDADDWVEAPFYCFDDQKIAYDADFLVDIFERSGPDAATAVLAHEWGHHLQSIRGMPEASLQRELQADCLAGFFMGAQYGDMTEITEATNAMRRVAEAGNERYRQSAWFDEAEHGSPGMRVIAFTMGSITGPFSLSDLGFCDGYTAYRPQPPIELGEFSLAHVPGFEHSEDSTGVTVSARGVTMRIEPLDETVLRAANTADEQIEAAWSAYSSEQPWAAYEDDLAPITSERPYGTITTMGYAAPVDSQTRFGFFTLHQDETGAALIVDSATNISDTSAMTPTENDDLVLAGNIGLAVESFVCPPSQSGDMASADYNFSCDLELDE